MTDAEYEAEKARVDALFDEWRARVGLSHWEWFITYHRATEAGVEPGVVMEVDSRWQYLWAAVDVYMDRSITRDDAGIENDVVHELAHCLVAPMRQPKVLGKMRDFEEYTVSSLARVLLVMAGKR